MEGKEDKHCDYGGEVIQTRRRRKRRRRGRTRARPVVRTLKIPWETMRRLGGVANCDFECTIMM